MLKIKLLTTQLLQMLATSQLVQLVTLQAVHWPMLLGRSPVWLQVWQKLLAEQEEQLTRSQT